MSHIRGNLPNPVFSILYLSPECFQYSGDEPFHTQASILWLLNSTEICNSALPHVLFISCRDCHHSPPAEPTVLAHVSRLCPQHPGDAFQPCPCAAACWESRSLALSLSLHFSISLSGFQQHCWLLLLSLLGQLSLLCLPSKWWTTILYSHTLLRQAHQDHGLNTSHRPMIL